MEIFVDQGKEFVIFAKSVQFDSELLTKCNIPCTILNLQICLTNNS